MPDCVSLSRFTYSAHENENPSALFSAGKIEGGSPTPKRPAHDFLTTLIPHRVRDVAEVDDSRRKRFRKSSFRFAHCEPERPASGALRRPARLRPRRDPEADQILGEIAHARAPHALPPRHLDKGRRDRAALLEIPPQLPLDPEGSRMLIGGCVNRRLNFTDPILSLLGLSLKIVEDHLLAPVQAHGRQRGRPFSKNNRKDLENRIIAFRIPDDSLRNVTFLSMWQKLKEQFPAIILTALLVTGGAFWLHHQTVADMTARQQAELTPLREQNDALKAAAEDNRREIEATNKLLKDAISRREADMFRTDEEIQKLNTERMDALAEAIAKKVQPYNPLPKTPEEAEQQQNAQIDKVSTRMADKIQPILAEMASDQHLTRDSINAYSQRISDQIGTVLTAELAKNQQLNNNLQSTQAVAQDSLKLSHEITALYLSSQKDQGLLTRLLTLPANVVKDVAHFNIIDKRDKDKVAQDLIDKMTAMEKRLNELQTQNPKK